MVKKSGMINTVKKTTFSESKWSIQQNLDSLICESIIVGFQTAPLYY